jgi:FKBP-type peptidyl-prolyl cis-trans isomerase SlpA
MPKLSENTVQQGGRIRLNFSLSLIDGTEVDSNFDSGAVELLIGNGDMLPGFESVLIGKMAGEKISCTVPAEQAFGVANDDNIQTFKRSMFDASINLEPGLIVSFADAAGAELPGVVVALDVSEQGTVKVDFNHPLAGRDIVFTAQIHEVLE